MPKTRRLSDLYVRGEEVEVDDGSGDPVKVWVSKLNSVDRESVFRRAQAAKARFMIDTDDEEGDTFIEEYGQVREYKDRDGLVALAISEDMHRYRERVEAEMATDEETWGKEGYLQGLMDSWMGTKEMPGLADALVEDPNDPEALRVQAEIDRFSEELNKLVLAERERLAAEWDNVPDETLWRKVAHVMLEQKATDAFVREVLRQSLFYSVRELDRTTRYFSTVAEVDDLEDSVRELLSSKLNALTVDTTEGKDSPGTEDSSPSSGSPVAAEEVPPSGPEAVNE